MIYTLPNTILRQAGRLAILCALFPATLCAQPGESDPVPWYQAVSLNGLVAASWTANFNHPESGMNALRVFDLDANSIEVDLAQLSISRSAAPGGVGFRIDLDAGPHIPAVSHSAGL